MNDIIYPITLNIGSISNQVNLTPVSTLPVINGSPPAGNIAILSGNETKPDGLYVWNGSTWILALSEYALSSSIIFGNVINVYANVQANVTVPSNGTVYQNGQSLALTTIPEGSNTIYVVTTPAITTTTLGLNHVNLLAKVKAGFSRDPKFNPYKNPPWLASPAWTTSATFQIQGQVVQGAGANSGNLYILDSSGGITATTGTGPSGTGVAPITDGSCTWYYYGPVRAPSAYPAAPTVTYVSTVGGGLSNHFAYNSNAFYYTGGVPTPVTAGYGYVFPIANTAPSTGNAYNDYNAFNPSIIFESDAPEICINGYIVWYNNTPIVVEVDGQFLQLGALVPASTLNPGGLLINWNGERKTRKYRIWMSPNVPFSGVYVDSSSSVWAYKNPNRWTGVFNGDSLIAGANGVPYIGQSWVDQLGYLLGCDNLYSVAVGGTGFIANVSGAATTYQQRLPDIAGLNPDYHFVMGNHNDGSYTSAARIAATEAYIQNALTLNPTTQIIVFGTDPGNSGASAVLAQEADLLTAVQSFNTPQVVFIPVSSDVIPWFNGTGTVSAPAGNGNSDVYTQPSGIHPVQGGENYRASRVANALINYFNSLPN